MMHSKRPGFWKPLALGALVACICNGPSEAARVSNPVASFSGLDKITGRITSFDVYVGETVQFGALQVTPRACFNRDETEAQRVDAFVEVDEITLDRKIRRIFNGWMFADSPALNAVEHPIFDVWLKDCKKTSDVPPPEGLKIPPSQPETTGQPAKPAAPAQEPAAPAAPAPVKPKKPATAQPAVPKEELRPIQPDEQLPPETDQNGDPLQGADPQQTDPFGQPGDQQGQDFGNQPVDPQGDLPPLQPDPDQNGQILQPPADNNNFQ